MKQKAKEEIKGIRDQHIHIKCTKREKEKIQKNAKKAGLRLSPFVRSRSLYSNY